MILVIIQLLAPFDYPPILLFGRGRRTRCSGCRAVASGLQALKLAGLVEPEAQQVLRKDQLTAV